MLKINIVIHNNFKEFGIHPKNWLFYRSVSGDKSDNVDGIKGFGPKTLLKLLNLESAEVGYTPEDIELLMETIDQVPDKKGTGKTIMKNISTLFENKEKVKRNWKLMSLKEPLLSAQQEQHITNRINSFEGNFKKLDLYRGLDRIGINLEGSLFDSLKFLS